MKRLKTFLALLTIVVTMLVGFATPAVAQSDWNWWGRHRYQQQYCGWYPSYWYGWQYWCWSPWYGWYLVWG
ncbi:MAG: hypothetical protein JOZ19_06560 [Rubrobacter sp.]|nr:hypothetical protein [Rubrobacter sp.]